MRTATPTGTLTRQQQQQFCVDPRRNPGCVPAAASVLQLCTHLLTRSGFRKYGGPGARHAMFAHHRPHSSGSAQFCGILGERLLAPVSDEKKHEAIAAARPAEATAETTAEA